MAAAAIISLVGQGVSTAGAIKSGKAQAAQLREQARENRQASLDELQRGREEVANFRTAARRALASSRAQASASGVSIEGSAADALGEAARNIEADALQIKARAQRRAEAFKRGGRLADEAASATSAATTLGAIGSGASALAKFGTSVFGGGGGKVSYGKDFVGPIPPGGSR
jgi:hypothetical protein